MTNPIPQDELIALMMEAHKKAHPLKTIPEPWDDAIAWADKFAQLIQQRDRQEYEQMKADAERYRYLRDTPWSQDLHRMIVLHANEAFDEAIYGARAAGKNKL